MSKTIPAGPRSGLFHVPSSKSQLHRLLILAALGREPTASIITASGSTAGLTGTSPSAASEYAAPG